jgi:hypothetical protein
MTSNYGGQMSNLNPGALKTDNDTISHPMAVNQELKSSGAPLADLIPSARGPPSK